MDINFRY